jgi:TPR repeat protein
MTALSHVRSFVVLFAAIGAMSALGCVQGEVFANRVQVGGLSYDAQESVEHALRHRPDPQVMREAMVAFSKACDAGEFASCSVVGVMYELGLNFPVDAHRARDLYGVACAAHNARACENLSELMAADPTDFHERVATLQP